MQQTDETDKNVRNNPASIINLRIIIPCYKLISIKRKHHFEKIPTHLDIFIYIYVAIRKYRFGNLRIVRIIVRSKLVSKISSSCFEKLSNIKCRLKRRIESVMEFHSSQAQQAEQFLCLLVAFPRVPSIFRETERAWWGRIVG